MLNPQNHQKAKQNAMKSPLLNTFILLDEKLKPDKLGYRCHL
jgi:hypothetical protein